MPHEIRIIRERKKDFLELLLLADEQENMIDLYLDRGELFALYDGGLKSVCVVTEETSDTCELKNLATLPAYQRQGYARALIRHISQYYRGHYRTMLVGTGETPGTLSFYESCGFVRSHRIPDFFTDHYHHSIDLAYTLTRQAELFADLLEGHFRTTDTEEVLDDVALTVGQRR